MQPTRERSPNFPEKLWVASLLVFFWGISGVLLFSYYQTKKEIREIVEEKNLQLQDLCQSTWEAHEEPLK